MKMVLTILSLGIVAFCVLSYPCTSAGNQISSFPDISGNAITSEKDQGLNKTEGDIRDGHSCHCVQFYCRCCMTYALHLRQHGKPYIYHPCLDARLIQFINLFTITVSMNNEILLKTPIRRRHVSICYSLPDPPTAHRTCLEFYHHEPWLLHMCARILAFFPRSLRRFEFGCFMMKGWVY